MTPSNHVAVIGLGAMGLPMATRLSGEFSVVAFDPVEERRTLAEQAGIATVQAPQDATRGAETVVVAVRDVLQAQEALADDGLLSAESTPRTVIFTSTVGSAAVSELAARSRDRGIELVDAPVSGGPVRAGRGELVIFVGATPQGRRSAAPFLDRLGSSIIDVGLRPGDGQLMKTINQLLAGVHIAAAAEAIALSREVGLDPAVVIEALAGGAAGSFMFSDRGPRMLDAYRGGAEVRSRIDIFVKDMGLVTELSRRAHVPTPLASAAEQLYLLAERAGLGAADDSSVVTMLSPPWAEER